MKKMKSLSTKHVAFYVAQNSHLLLVILYTPGSLVNDFISVISLMGNQPIE